MVDPLKATCSLYEKKNWASDREETFSYSFIESVVHLQEERGRLTVWCSKTGLMHVLSLL